MSDVEIIKDTIARGRQFTVYSDGTQWTRRVDAAGKALTEWKQLESVPAALPEPLKLHVVARHQAEGEPKHWALFASRPDANGKTHGQAWQVTGDAEYMHYDHAGDIDLFNSASFAWHQTLNSNLSDSDFVTVDRLARSEVPPRAKSRREVTENCQGWTIRLLRRLVAEGIVEQSAVVALQQYMDPIN